VYRFLMAGDTAGAKRGKLQGNGDEKISKG